MRKPRPVYVLDLCALIAWLRDEPGSETIAAMIEAQQATMHALTLCEVYYDTVRARGRDKALEMLADAREVVEVNEELGPDFLVLAGDLKARGGIALADTFAAALAIRTNGIVVTADRKEFESVVARGWCRVEFFR